MRAIATVALLTTPVLLAACGPATESTPEPLTEKQAKVMDRELKGRVAGTPQNCIPTYNSDGLVRGSDSILIYKPGGVVYVNNLKGSCPGLGSDSAIIVTQSYGSQTCDGDLIKLVDRSSGIQGPVCSLGQFVPYKKPKG